jgi:hypothetical protein
MSALALSPQRDNIGPPAGQHSPSRGTMSPHTVPQAGLIVTKAPPLQSPQRDTSNIPGIRTAPAPRPTIKKSSAQRGSLPCEPVSPERLNQSASAGLSSGYHDNC